jgi:hypothetical protein
LRSISSNSSVSRIFVGSPKFIQFPDGAGNFLLSEDFNLPAHSSENLTSQNPFVLEREKVLVFPFTYYGFYGWSINTGSGSAVAFVDLANRRVLGFLGALFFLDILLYFVLHVRFLVPELFSILVDRLLPTDSNYY